MDRRRGLEPVLEAATADDSQDRVATDGGELVVAGDEGEVLEESDDDGRPEDCGCAELLADAGLPCWPCSREGFREPARAVPDDRPDRVRERLEDVHAELQAIDEDLPEPLTLTPALRCVGSTVELYYRLESHGIEDHGNV